MIKQLNSLPEANQPHSDFEHELLGTNLSCYVFSYMHQPTCTILYEISNHVSGDLCSNI